MEGLNLPENVRRSLASAVAERGPQARAISSQPQGSMRPPQAHLVVAASPEDVAAVRGPVKVIRQLEFYKTFYGPVVRLAFSIYPEDGPPLSAATLLNISQTSGDTALSGLARQKSLYLHLYEVSEDTDLSYALSKELSNAGPQREQARNVLRKAREAYSQTPEERRAFRAAVGLAERNFELPVREAQ